MHDRRVTLARKAGVAIWFATFAASAQTPRVLTLEEALRVARERQPQIRQARFLTEAAYARADQARSGLLPQVSATAGYQKTTANFIARPGAVPGAVASTTSTGSRLSFFNFFNSSISVNQLLWDFGQTHGRYQAAKTLREAQENNERAVSLQIENILRAAFFLARANRALVVVANEAVVNFGKHLEQIQGFVEVGTRPEIDLAQARADLASSRAQLIDAQNNYLIAKAQLNQAMGVIGPTDYEVADQSLAPVPGEEAPIDVLANEAMKARPELLALEDQIRAQLQTVSAIKGAYGPTLDATAGSTQGGTRVDNLGWNVAVGVTLTWQIYQGGLTTAQVREAEALAGQLAAQLDLQREQVRFDVEQASLAVRAAKALIEADRETVVNARDRLRLAEGRYETGVGNAIELGDAQVALTTAEAQTVQADDRLSTARAQLLRALGRQ
jgi:outer membrane protein